MKKLIISIIALFSLSSLQAQDLRKIYINVKSICVENNRIKGPIFFMFDNKLLKNDTLVTEVQLIKEGINKITSFYNSRLYTIKLGRKLYYLCVDENDNKIFRIKDSKRNPKIEIYNLDIIRP